MTKSKTLPYRMLRTLKKFLLFRSKEGKGYQNTTLKWYENQYCIWQMSALPLHFIQSPEYFSLTLFPVCTFA